MHCVPRYGKTHNGEKVNGPRGFESPNGASTFGSSESEVRTVQFTVARKAGTRLNLLHTKNKTLFLVFDFRFVFSSFGHENIYFFCRLWEFECAKYYIFTICTIGQIDHYGLYKVITFQIFDFVSKFWFSWRHGRTNTQLINGPSAGDRSRPMKSDQFKKLGSMSLLSYHDW